MDVCLLWVFVLSGRGLCNELITRPEDSYRLWCVVVYDLENLKNEEPLTHAGSQRHKRKVEWTYPRVSTGMWTPFILLILIITFYSHYNIIQVQKGSRDCAVFTVTRLCTGYLRNLGSICVSSKRFFSSSKRACRLAIPHLTLRWLMSYIYGAPILDVSRSYTTTQHSR